MPLPDTSSVPHMYYRARDGDAQEGYESADTEPRGLALARSSHRALY